MKKRYLEFEQLMVSLRALSIQSFTIPNWKASVTGRHRSDAGPLRANSSLDLGEHQNIPSDFDKDAEPNRGKWITTPEKI